MLEDNTKRTVSPDCSTCLTDYSVSPKVSHHYVKMASSVRATRSVTLLSNQLLLFINVVLDSTLWCCAHIYDKQFTSVVTVSKCFLSVGFGRFCRKKPRFSVRFSFS